MPKHGKRYQEALKTFDKMNQYSLEEAVKLAKENAKAKFDETIELAFKLGVDPRHADQQIRGAVVLPHGTGKKRTVLVFAKGEKAKEAEAAGADFVGDADMVAKIQEGWFGFDVAIATPDMMGVVGKIGRVLGPKGLMPNPKTGTVTLDVKKAVEDVKAGKIEYRVDKTSIISVPIGKASFEIEKLLDNANTIIDVVKKAKPATSKGQYMKTLTVASTMGPGVKINPFSV